MSLIITTKSGAEYEITFHIFGDSTAYIKPLGAGEVRGWIAGIGEEMADTLKFKKGKKYKIKPSDFEKGKIIYTTDINVHTSPIISVRKA